MLEHALSSRCVHSRPHDGFLCTSASFELQPGVRRCSGRHTASSGPPSGSSQSTTKLPPLSWPQTSKLETVRRTAKQDQNRINRVLHNSRVVPLVIFFEECYHQVSWSKTRRKDGKGHGRTVGTQHFQEHSRKIPEDSWYQLTGRAWLVRQAKHSQIFQVANWRHRPPIRIIPTDLDSAVLEVLRASPSSARYLMNFVYLRLFMSLLQANFQSFSTVAVYQFRSSSQSASTRFPLSIQIEAVNQRRTSRINLFLGLQNCHRRAPKHCEITPVSTTVTKKGSGKGWKAGEENMKSLEMLQT